MVNNICPLCGGKLNRGYCSECGGNMTTACDGDESYFVHESHEKDHYTAFEDYTKRESTVPYEAYERHDYAAPNSFGTAGSGMNGRTAGIRTSYTVSNSEPEYRKAKRPSFEDESGERDKNRVLFIVLSALIPFFGFVAGIMLRRVAQTPEKQKTGTIMLIVSIASFVASQAIFPMILNVLDALL